MDATKALFTAGQFAKLHHINKRTLHYYDDIGLFSPSHKGENGYRYYTYLQSPTLEMILALRELGMSIEEINNYLHNRSADAFHKVITEKTAELDNTIKQLKEIRKLLVQKESQLIFCEKTDLNIIELVDCPEEYLLLSNPINGTYDDSDFSVLIEHMQSSRDHRLYNKSYGSMTPVKKIYDPRAEGQERLFTRIPHPKNKSGLFVKPAGQYIRAFCKGNWDLLPETYTRIKEYTQIHGRTLSGYAYEEGINEMTISTMDDYVTQITILSEPVL